MQYIIKDCRGTDIQSRARFHNYTQVAREMLSIGAALPLTVWTHNTVTGMRAYDGARTRKLSDGVCMARELATTPAKSAEALEALRKVDFSQQAYRGYLVRTNALSNTMWVEKDGQLICHVPPDKSWEWARAQIDELAKTPTLNGEQSTAARRMRSVRPPVIPGTNVIVADSARTEWYDKVASEMQRLGVNTPELTKEFCDIAGVPN